MPKAILVGIAGNPHTTGLLEPSHGGYGATSRLEWPVHTESSGQAIADRLDVLIDLPDGFALVEHESFHGTLALDNDRLRAFAGQSLCSARAVEAVLGKPCHAVWAHEPVVVGVGPRA